MENKINFKDLLGPMRVPFLLLPPMCVLLGIGTAYWTTGKVNILYAVLALIGAVSSHISVNAFNEYFDFKSGLDTKTPKTPFSGGSGTLPARPELARSALATASVSLLIPTLIGLYFLVVRGPAILPIGILGIVLVVTYTTWITQNPILCLFAPGLGFGTLWVMGTNFVLTGGYSWTAFTASLVPFFLVSNLLLLNQFPDVEADRSVGRRHLPILLGRQASSYIYVAFLACTYLSVISGYLLGVLPAWALMGLLTLLLAIPAGLGAVRYNQDIQKLMPAMGMNVLINLLTPLLVAVGLFIARALT
jgi:1,4-dihydroxy-2-naphthoate octaprenyltransferase